MFAQFERDVIIDRATAGMERKAASGKWNGGRRPYGYLVNEKTQVLYPNEAEAVVVRLIFDLYTRHRAGSHAIALLLNERGYRTTGGGFWSHKQVIHALTHRGLRRRDQLPRRRHRELSPRVDQSEEVRRGQSDPRTAQREPWSPCGERLGLHRHRQAYLPEVRQAHDRYPREWQDQDLPLLHVLEPLPLWQGPSFYRSQHILISETVDAARSHHESSHVAVNAELKVIHAEIAKVTGKIDKYLDAFEDDELGPEDGEVQQRLLLHRTKQRQLRDRRAELQSDLNYERTMLDAATSLRSPSTSPRSSRPGTTTSEKRW